MNEFLETRRAGSRRQRRGDAVTAMVVVRGRLCLAAAVAALWPVLVEHPQSVRWVAAVSPFVTVASLLAGCAVGAAAIAGLAVAAIAVFRRRWFCRWICPTGSVPTWRAALAAAVGSLRPARGAAQQIGQWIALATLAGACVGYPLFLWLDPLAMFGGAFSLRGPGYEAIGWWTAAGLPAVVLLSLLLPGVWCGRLCPLGGMQELLWSAVAFLAARASARWARPRRATS